MSKFSAFLKELLSQRGEPIARIAKNTGLAHTFAAAADKKKVRAVLLATSVVLAVVLMVVGCFLILR